MKSRVELWVRLKVVDLVAQTAWMTLTEKLDFAGALRGIVRYSYWGMDAESDSKEEIIEEIDRVIRLDSAFTNQNKHTYFLKAWDPDGGKDLDKGGISRGDLDLRRDYPGYVEKSNRSAGRSIFACDLLVREQSGGKEQGFLARLDSRLEKVEISGMSSGEVWRLVVEAETREEAAEKVEEMAVTRSRREGLLLNPHYQRYEILGMVELHGEKESVS